MQREGHTQSTPEPLADHLVAGIIYPDHQTIPFGKDDALSEYVYRPMRESGSADIMIRVIDHSERFIDQTEVDSELNQLTILRLITLVADTPEELPLEEKTRAWRHLIDTDWVHMFGDTGELDRVVRQVANEDPDLGDEIRKVQRDVFTQKSQDLYKVVGTDERVPHFEEEGFELNRAMDGYNVVRKDYSASLPAYNTLVALAMSQHQMAVR